MRKLTYLVASLLVAVTAGTTFTGCINSDEPAGIEHLRDAKAALLKSKQALIEAQAAKALAEAEAIKVEAAAQAALIDAERAKTEAEIAEIKQRTADAMLQAQVQLESLQQQLERLKLTYEQEKLQLSEAQKTYIEYYYNKYFTALEEYNEKYIAWLDAQKQLVKEALDPDGTNFDKQKEYEDDVTEAEKNLADANEEIAELKKNLEEAKTWTPTELGAKLTQYKEEKAANEEQIALLTLKKAENESESEEGKRYQELQAERTNIYEEWVNIPAYTFNADGSVTIPGIEKPKEVLKEGRFSLKTEYQYWNASNALSNFKSQISGYVLNDNDQAWTQAEINELTRGKAEYDKTYEADLAKWQMFVTAYNKGAEPDYSALEGYDAVNEAVTAYNKTLASVETAKAALIKAETARDEASKALNDDAANKAQEDKDAAYTAAYTAYGTASDAARKEYDATIAKLNEAVDKAQLDLTEGEAKRVEAENLATKYPEDADLKKAAEEAAKTVTDVLKPALEAAEKARDEQGSKAEAKHQKAIDVAYAALKVAIAEADKAYDLAMMEVDKTNAALYEAYLTAQSKYGEAYAAYDDEVNKARTALFEISDAVNEQAETIGGGFGYYFWDYYTKFDAATSYTSVPGSDADADWIEARKAFEEAVPECTVADVCAYQTDELKQNVKETSHALYGWAWTPKAYEGAYLVSLTKEELLDYIKSKYYEPSAETIQNELYNSYGSFGKVLACENRIEVAQAYISNKAAVDAAFAELDKRIEDLTASHEAQVEKYDKAGEECQKAWQAVNDLNAELEDQIRALNSKNSIADAMIVAIETAAGKTLADQAGLLPDNYTQETIDAAIENLETTIEEKEKDIPGLEREVEKAKYKLDQYEKGLLSDADIAQLDVEEAKLAMDLAKAKLDEAKAQLDAANKRLDESAA